MARIKIINDPVYGFISVPYGILLELIDHPYFQRLRRISQLGLSSIIYPGATHTRFHHALGAMYLMQDALNTLKHKGHEISETEAEAAQIAILLHDKVLLLDKILNPHNEKNSIHYITLCQHRHSRRATSRRHHLGHL